MRAVLAAAVCAAAVGGSASAQDVAEAPLGGVVRWLDKVSGEVRDIELAPGESRSAGRLTITLEQCRYRVADPASNAWGFLVIRDALVPEPVFRGWMIADSPALNAMDHARFDVWMLRCTISDGAGTAP